MLSSPLNFSLDLIKHILKCFAGLVPKKGCYSHAANLVCSWEKPQVPHHSLFTKTFF